MAPVTTLKDFFEKRRRRLSLLRYTHLKTRAGEERLKLELKMPLLNESLQGVPELVSQAFDPMAKDASAIKRSNLNIEYKGMTVEFFSNDQAAEPFIGKEGIASATGALLTKFALVAEGESDKRTLDLVYVCYVPASVALLDWARQHLHLDFFGECEYSQSELEFTPEVEDPEPAAVVAEAPAQAPAKKPKKSGPKDLKEYHDQQEAVPVGATEAW